MSNTSLPPSSSLFSLSPQGTTYEVGDIVSILGEEGQLYYALIRGFLEDQYAEKYAILTWLVPTVPNPKNFDPSLFVLGEILCSLWVLGEGIGGGAVFPLSSQIE